MSIPEPSPATMVTVEPWLADVLRQQALVIQKVNHHGFAGFSDLPPETQSALASVYTDAFALMEAVGWSPDPDAGPVEVPLTPGLIEQLYRRRYVLGSTNFERLDALQQAQSELDAEAIRGQIEADRRTCQALDRLFADYDRALNA